MGWFYARAELCSLGEKPGPSSLPEKLGINGGEDSSQGEGLAAQEVTQGCLSDLGPFPYVGTFTVTSQAR